MGDRNLSLAVIFSPRTKGGFQTGEIKSGGRWRRCGWKKVKFVFRCRVHLAQKVLNLLDSDGKMKIWKWRCQDIGDDESGLQKINWNIAYMTLMSMMKRKVVVQTTTQGVTERNPNTQTWGIMTARLNLWFYTVCISKGEEILHSANFTQCVFQNMKSRSHSHSCQGSLCVKSESVGVT